MQNDMCFQELYVEVGPVLTNENGGGPTIGADLSTDQKGKFQRLVREFQDVFSEWPGEAKGVHINTPSRLYSKEPLENHWRKLLRHLLKLVKNELD